MSEMKAIRAAYGEALVELGAQNDKVVVLDADLAHATMTLGFAQKYPDRFFNAGIAEANMVSMAAGMSRTNVETRPGSATPQPTSSIARTRSSSSSGDSGPTSPKPHVPG